jgi:hypothetical protein
VPDEPTRMAAFTGHRVRRGIGSGPAQASAGCTMIAAWNRSRLEFCGAQGHVQIAVGQCRSEGWTHSSPLIKLLQPDQGQVVETMAMAERVM